ncbi:uncharacterized protein PV07_12692 [Cladophialophora immunda]|uniref:Uncharacterized protein n=1 Tax=Cladophialophora immunda TaxID=569365 RepID=A0A0D2BTZ5_9EURO|nr:uncharacterized protein PV07_12692 [Cladophialophora immunda]KIW21895.1 hypothetical protein PV07_12692 [Cladophialophora immunda]
MPHGQLRHKRTILFHSFCPPSWSSRVRKCSTPGTDCSVRESHHISEPPRHAVSSFIDGPYSAPTATVYRRSILTTNRPPCTRMALEWKYETLSPNPITVFIFAPRPALFDLVREVISSNGARPLWSGFPLGPRVAPTSGVRFSLFSCSACSSVSHDCG